MMKTRLLGMMDDSIDGKLQPTELRGQLAGLTNYFGMADADKDGGLNSDELQAVLATIRTMRGNRPAGSGGAQ